MNSAPSPSPVARPPRRPRRWLAGAACAATLAVVSCASNPSAEVKGAEVTRPSTTVATTTVVGPVGATSPKTTAGAATTTTPESGATTTAPPSPTISNAPVGVHTIVPHAATYRGGKLYLTGDIPSRKVGDELKAKAVAVIGAPNVIDQYKVDPAAPAVTDGRVIVDEPLLFPTASATLNPGYDYLIGLGVAVMTQNPKVTMRVIGYTDDVGDANSNIVLATARALAVVDRISSYGIDRSRFVYEGKGEADPIASNATPEGRTLNRRITVDLLHLIG